MSALSLAHSRIIRVAYSLLLLIGVGFPLGIYAKPIFREQGAPLREYIQTLEAARSVDEILTHLIQMRDRFLSAGYLVPEIMTIRTAFYLALDELRIELSENERQGIDLFFERLMKKEDLAFSSIEGYFKFCSKKEDEEEGSFFGLSLNQLLGIAEFVGGAFCCAIPLPAAQGFGAALMVAGIERVANDSSNEEAAEEKAKRPQNSNE